MSRIPSLSRAVLKERQWAHLKNNLASTLYFYLAKYSEGVRRPPKPMSEGRERAGIEKREKQTIKSPLDLLNREQY